MATDSAYFSSSKKSLALLLEGAGGVWGDIPEPYLGYFTHSYADGDISLLPSVGNLQNTDLLESWEVEDAISTLLKVDPECWPDCDSIESIDAEMLLVDESEDAGSLDYVEDNLGASEKTQKVLKGVLESVFGDEVGSIRSKQGKYPSPSNNFLQDKDGTFVGTFKFDDFVFDFEIAPTEKGWICTYRLEEKSLDKLDKPEFRGKRKDNKPNHRKVRSQGWR